MKPAFAFNNATSRAAIACRAAGPRDVGWVQMPRRPDACEGPRAMGIMLRVRGGSGSLYA
jgi:hypothetical protein